MELDVVTKADVARRKKLPLEKQADIQTVPDDWYNRLLKFIPVPIIGGYLAAEGILPEIAESPNARKLWLWVIFAVLGVFTWGYLWSRGLRRRLQVLVAVGSYVVWVFALGGPFQAQFKSWEPWMGSLAVILTAVGLVAFNLPVPPRRREGLEDEHHPSR